MESISLYFTNDKSDKEYHASIEEAEGGFVVNFAYGRRGSSLRTGTKTQKPIPLDKAKAIYDKLVKGKVSKGYTEQDDGVVYTSCKEEHSGFMCQLLNPIDLSDVKRLINDDNYIMQRKYNGVRLPIENTGVVRGINRRGLYVGISTKLKSAHEKVLSEKKLASYLMDGEGFRDKQAVFDIVELNGEDLRDKPYMERFNILIGLAEGNGSIVLAEYAIGKEAKAEMFKKAKEANWEGVVFKEISSKYEADRPNSMGSQLKYKFYETSSVIVQKINDKRSVSIGVVDGENTVSCGNVTIPPNKNIPEVGDIIEVRYLYAIQGTNALYQPTYIMKRVDIPKEECLIEQFKYKEVECI